MDPLHQDTLAPSWSAPRYARAARPSTTNVGFQGEASTSSRRASPVSTSARVPARAARRPRYRCPAGRPTTSGRPPPAEASARSKSGASGFPKTSAAHPGRGLDRGEERPGARPGLASGCRERSVGVRGHERRRPVARGPRRPSTSRSRRHGRTPRPRRRPRTGCVRGTDARHRPAPPGAPPHRSTNAECETSLAQHRGRRQRGGHDLFRLGLAPRRRRAARPPAPAFGWSCW